MKWHWLFVDVLMGTVGTGMETERKLLLKKTYRHICANSLTRKSFEQMFAQKCIINKYALNIRIQNLVPSGDEPNAGEATGTSDLGSVILKLVSMCVFHVF